MQSVWLTLTVTAMAGAGGYLIWRGRPRQAEGASTAHLPSPYEAKSTPSPQALPKCVGNRLPVMSYPQILEYSGTANLIRSIRDKSGATGSAFEDTWLPTLRAAAEFVQLLPASESHHHANPGGLWRHMLECVDFALNLRRGVILPVGAPPEDVMWQEHRWTYGVFLGAFLHDIGRPIADLRVTRYDEPALPGKLWQPLAGSLIDFGASHYSVDFTDPGQRDYEAHKRLGAILLQRMIRSKTLQWLSEDPTLMHSLNQYLAGETQTGSIAELCRQADQESVRRNLQEGPRTRFASARAVPLIERLMEALRRQLADNVIPLNRAGAMGFVFQNSIWFIAKPVADAVREYLQKNESGTGLPGDDKNDRLFDCWQEYGAILPNPETSGAIWTVQIISEALPSSMTSQAFTMLRFPLSKLYEQEDSYPRPFSGEILPVPRGGRQKSVVIQPNSAPLSALSRPSNTEGTGTAQALPEQECNNPSAEADSTNAVSKSMQEPNPTGTVTSSEEDDPFADINEQTNLPPPKDELATGTVNQLVEATGTALAVPPDESTAPIVPVRHDTAPISNPADRNDWLDETESANTTATAEKIKPVQAASPSKHRRVAPPQIKAGPSQKKAASSTPSEAPKPVPNSNSALPALPGHSRKEPSKAAMEFMKWIQQGICDSTLLYNDSGAMVHFVPEGMLLVSPVIFRRYAELFGEPPRRSAPTADAATPDGGEARLGLSIQREVVDAGWHLQLPKRNNIVRYQVLAKGKPGKMLSGVLIQQPDRWLNPLPPANPLLAKVKNEILTSLGGKL
jgi:integrating conjugative element relaxase (TIGR03760 family)